MVSRTAEEVKEENLMEGRRKIKSYGERCKKTGRIGPIFTELDPKSKYGEASIRPDSLVE
jgi:hypothetical protein